MNTLRRVDDWMSTSDSLLAGWACALFIMAIAWTCILAVAIPLYFILDAAH